MKTAIYIEDGVVQLVITPESEFEKSSLRMFQDGDVPATIFQGSFYDCRGGWTRQEEVSRYGNNNNEDRSLILRVKEQARRGNKQGGMKDG